MPLNLYRRHRQECEASHPEESRSGEFEERKKTWKRCGCVIFAAGTLAGKFRRVSTARSSWEDAKEIVTRWETSGRWEQPGQADLPVEPVPPVGITLEKAVQSFLAEHDRNSAINTRKKYKLIMDRLTQYAEHKGYLLLTQWGPAAVRECRSLWTVAPQTANRDMSVVRSFFEFCFTSEWIDRNPAKLVKNTRGRSGSEGRGEQKLPFTDEELTRMYDCCEQRYGKMEIKWLRTSHGKPAEGLVNNYKYKWTGRDLADFILLSTYTGLRISDVATFHVSRLNENGEVHVRTTKAGVHVNTWVPEFVQQMIRRRSLAVGASIFGEHETIDMNVVTDIWRRKLKRLWKMCGPWTATPVPHRFRHTFARILLSRPGVEVRDVSDLLGNTEQIVRKHYSAWIPARQERLTAILKAAFAETPRPGIVIEMPKSGTK